VVELCFFGGLNMDEAAQVLGCSRATAERSGYLARAWLRRHLIG
jgi:DNA-directed RNA polymerase specialized sigma24 family protein